MMTGVLILIADPFQLHQSISSPHIKVGIQLSLSSCFFFWFCYQSLSVHGNPIHRLLSQQIYALLRMTGVTLQPTLFYS